MKKIVFLVAVVLTTTVSFGQQQSQSQCNNCYTNSDYRRDALNLEVMKASRFNDREDALAASQIELAKAQARYLKQQITLGYFTLGAKVLSDALSVANTILNNDVSYAQIRAMENIYRQNRIVYPGGQVVYQNGQQYGGQPATYGGTTVRDNVAIYSGNSTASYGSGTYGGGYTNTTGTGNTTSVYVQPAYGGGTYYPTGNLSRNGGL